MGSTSGPHCILTINLIEKHFLFLFFLMHETTHNVSSALPSLLYASFIP
jgi:hypothetical protein